MSSPSGLGDRPNLTQSSYRRAVAAIIRNIQARAGESDQDTADRLGVSAATVGNARNEKGDLAAVTLLRIGQVYGLASIGPAMLLIGGKAAPVDATCTSDRHMPSAVARGQLFLAVALADDNEVSDDELLAPGAGDAIEASGQVFDALRYRRATLTAGGLVEKRVVTLG